MRPSAPFGEIEGGIYIVQYAYVRNIFCMRRSICDSPSEFLRLFLLFR